MLIEGGFSFSYRLRMSPLVRANSNYFGALRLLFASLVIWGHAPQLLDGNDRREPLLQIFGTITLGQLSVDAFFIISGYLVTGSFIQSSTVGSFLTKRVLRIVPGFAAAYLIGMFVIAPLAGADLAAVTVNGWLRIAAHMLLLDQPALIGAFAQSPIPLVNGAMWTIGLEFRCYLIAALLGTIGLYARPRRYVVLAALVVAIAAACRTFFPETLGTRDIGRVEMILLANGPHFLRVTALFMAGGVCRLLPAAPRLTPKAAGLCIVGIVACLTLNGIAELGLAIFGSYLLIAVGRSAAPEALARLNSTDVSYGTYLYAWPISQGLIVAMPAVSPVALALLTMPLAMLAGLASWLAVERPAVQSYHRLRARPARLDAPPADSG